MGDQRKRSRCILLFVCFLCLLILGWRKYEKEEYVETEFLQSVEFAKMLPNEYSLQSAVEDGYYCEQSLSRDSERLVRQFLNHAGGRGNASFKKAEESDYGLVLEYICYIPREYRVFQFVKNRETEKTMFYQNTYQYMVVLTDTASKHMSYYLTNDENLAKENATGRLSLDETNQKEIFYLFTTSYKR